MELQVLNCKKNVLSYLTYEVIVFIMGFYTYVTYLALVSPAFLFLSPMYRHIFLDPSLSRNPIVHPAPHPSSLLPPPPYYPFPNFMAYAHTHTHKYTHIKNQMLSLAYEQELQYLLFSVPQLQ